MSNTIEFQGTQDLQAHSQKPLDETVWRAWLGKNLLQEKQRAATRIKAVKWACIGVLIVSAVASSYISTPYVSAYQTVVRFAIGLGAIVIMFESLVVVQFEKFTWLGLDNPLSALRTARNAKRQLLTAFSTELRVFHLDR